MRIALDPAVAGIDELSAEWMARIDPNAGARQRDLARILQSPTARRKIDWDEVLRKVNARWEEIVAFARQPLGPAAAKRVDERRRELEAARERTIREWPEVTARATSSGHVSPDWLLRAWESAETISVPTEQYILVLKTRDFRRKLIGVALALVVHKAEVGEYPDSLDALSPAYLREVPDDPFAGGPPRYRREGDGFVLYSIGRNCVDDGGKDDDFTGKEVRYGDIVVRVPAAGLDHEELP